MTKEQFMSILRHVITFVGGLLIANGSMDATSIETIAGVIVSLAGLVWGFMAPEKAPLTAEAVVAKLGPEKVAAVDKILQAPTPVRPTVPIDLGGSPGTDYRFPNQ